jgi:hypothetical protein
MRGHLHSVDLGRRSRLERLKLKTAGRYPSSLEPSHWRIKFRINCKGRKLRFKRSICAGMAREGGVLSLLITGRGQFRARP